MLNEKIKQAILEAASEERQSVELANKLIAWMENLVEGNEDVADQTAYTERCSLCFEKTIVLPNSEE